MIVDVTPGTTAERLDMKAKDILLEVSGAPIRGVADVRNALLESAAGVEVTVFRKGKRVVLKSI